LSKIAEYERELMVNGGTKLSSMAVVNDYDKHEIAQYIDFLRDTAKKNRVDYIHLLRECTELNSKLIESYNSHK